MTSKEHYFYNNEIENVYIVNGLARSGNHLFITWLMSGLNDNSIYYLNNIKPRFHGLLGSKKYGNSLKKSLKQIFQYNSYYKGCKLSKKIDEKINKKLASKKKMENFLLSGKNIDVKNLIISMENKKTIRMDQISKIFTNCKKIYLIITIRDIFNLFSSRMESEKTLKKSNKNDDWVYETDKITIKYWCENYKASKENKKKYITFNYNLFICSDIFKKQLAKKLKIDYKKTLVTINKFGLTKGSSFGNDKKNTMANYFSRWRHNLDKPLIKKLLRKRNMINIMKKDFKISITPNFKKMLICDDIHINFED